jgi:hypothetical protein
MKWTRYASVAAAATAIGVLSLTAPRAMQVSQEPAGAAQITAGAVEAQDGLFALSGGPVLAKLARTGTSLNALTEGTWRGVGGAIITRVVPAGTSDLFNIAFSAECQVRSLGVGDTARIRIAHFVNGVQVASIEPDDGDQRFCSATSPVATHKGNWAQRVGPGSHVVQVQIMPVDFGVDNGVIVATIDDWTFELVVYD